MMKMTLRWGTADYTHKIHQYIPNSPTPEAHTLETWTSSAPHPTSANKYWIIYIHGGAWWRPMIDASSFTLTVSSLLQSPLLPRISGFASLNYRLSTPPPLPQFTEFTQLDNPARNIKHPAHLHDVEAAITYLQDEYGFGGDYVLVGHSCGATLAFQLQEKRHGVLVGPKGVLGVEGIYDLGKLVEDHAAIPMYRYFTESAFGKDGGDWVKASPTTQVCEECFAWEKAKVVAIAQSEEDELVDVGQRDVMWDVMVRNGANENKRREEKIEMRGKHDEVWKIVREEESGTQLSYAMAKVLELLIED